MYDAERNPRLGETFDGIARIAARARERGIDFALAPYPMMLDLDRYPFEAVDATIVHLAAERGIRTIDLLTAFESEGPGRRLVVHSVDAHPNAAAADIAARAIDRALER